jgi:hypothetical protein
MSIHDRIRDFDFDNAGPHDIAVLMEQVFLYQSSNCRDGGPIITAQNVLEQFEAAIRRRSAPELHAKTHSHLREMRSSLVQFETTLSKLERDAAKRQR